MTPETALTAPPGPAAVGERLAAEGVHTFFGFYVDAHGVPKAKAVPIAHLEQAAEGSELYTVGALEGMGRLGPNEDEVQGHPDLGRVVVLPWDRRYAMAPADLVFHGRPYSHDSRHVLRRQVQAAAELGYRFNAGVEPEVYVLRETDGRIEPLVASDERNAPTRGYDIDATMLADPFLEPMVSHIDALGWDVYSYDHEGGDGQYEFDFGYAEGLEMADRMVLFRLMAKHVARTLGCFASFMPKPFSDAFGSGAHVNMSLESIETGENAFRVASSRNGAGRAADGRDPRYTELAYRFAAGLVRHGAAITALACPTVNSYKRLLPRGLMDEISWAPVYRAWGINNRTLMVRLPGNRPCIELRTADSAANFYLVMGLALAAGLEGIRAELDPGEACNVDTYSVGDEGLARRGVHRLPRTLGEAIDAFEADELARAVLGPAFHADYAALKRREWETYNTVVSEWEREQYLHLW
jgi:glutamine synthetase